MGSDNIYINISLNFCKIISTYKIHIWWISNKLSISIDILHSTVMASSHIYWHQTKSKFDVLHVQSASMRPVSCFLQSVYSFCHLIFPEYMTNVIIFQLSVFSASERSFYDGTWNIHHSREHQRNFTIFWLNKENKLC